MPASIVGPDTELGGVTYRELRIMPAWTSSHSASGTMAASRRAQEQVRRVGAILLVVVTVAVVNHRALHIA